MYEVSYEGLTGMIRKFFPTRTEAVKEANKHFRSTVTLITN